MPTLQYIDVDEDEDDVVEVVQAPPPPHSESPSCPSTVTKGKVGKKSKLPPAPVSNTKPNRKAAGVAASKRKSTPDAEPSEKPIPVAVSNTKPNRKAPATAGSKRKSAPDTEPSATATGAKSNKKSNKESKGQLKLGAFFSKANASAVQTKKSPKEGLSPEKLEELREICIGKEIKMHKTPKQRVDITTFVSPNDDEEHDPNNYDKLSVAMEEEEDPAVGTEALEKALGAASSQHSPLAAGKSAKQTQNQTLSEANISWSAHNKLEDVAQSQPSVDDCPKVTEDTPITPPDAEEETQKNQVENEPPSPPQEKALSAEDPLVTCRLREEEIPEYPSVTPITSAAQATKKPKTEETHGRIDQPPSDDTDMQRGKENLTSTIESSLLKQEAHPPARLATALKPAMEENHEVSKEPDLKLDQSLVDPENKEDTCSDDAEAKEENKKDECSDDIESSEDKRSEDTEAEAECPEVSEPTESTKSTSKVDLKTNESRKDTRRKIEQPKSTGVKVKGTGRKTKTGGSPKPLDEASQVELAKLRSMKDSYMVQAKELLPQCCELNQKEQLSYPKPDLGESVAFPKETFPDFALQELCARVEGQSLCLSALAEQVTKQLNEAYETDCFVSFTTAEKIKLVATRKNYIKSPQVVSETNVESPTPDVMQDVCTEFIWRWEVDVMELLPTDCAAAAKKDRAALRLASMPFNAVAKIILLLTDLEKAILAGGSGSQVKREKLNERIRQEEEKLVKLQEAKQEVREKRKRQEEEQDLKDRKREEQQKLKQQLAEEKKRQRLLTEQQKQQALKEKETQKEEVLKEREAKKQAALDAKRLKEEEAQKAEQEKQAKVHKQASLMMSFLAKSKPKTEKKMPATSSVAKVNPEAQSSEMGSSFSVLPLIGSGEDCKEPSIFPIQLSVRAKQLRRPSCKTVERTVFVSVQDENYDPWATDRPFAEERTIQLRSLFKLFRFGGEHRPAYYGTWSKKSKLITGRRPFAKDTQFFDYDYDSADDWEEGDDEVGEELGDDDEDDVEPDDDEKLPEDEDGWLAADDDNDDDVDEETRHLRKKMRLELENRTNTALVLIGPFMGGRPLTATAADARNDVANVVEGIELKQAIELLQSQRVLTVQDCDDSVALDAAFPPSMTEENCGSGEDGAVSSVEKKLSDDEMKIFLGFVHNNTQGSKEKLVDQMRSELLPTLSRNMALKTLETVAEKKKHPVRGFLWEVKRDVLDQSGLSHLAVEDDAEELKRQHLRRMAQLVHHSTATSKEKLADELLAASTTPAMSKAESLRLVLQLGAKCKTPSGGYYWQVRDEVQRDLDLSLPRGAPTQLAPTQQGNS